LYASQQTKPKSPKPIVQTAMSVPAMFQKWIGDDALVIVRPCCPTAPVESILATDQPEYKAPIANTHCRMMTARNVRRLKILVS
jgi:hypothetical protein